MISSVARLCARLAHLAVLTGLVAAIPAGLVRYIGWPLPDHMPTAEELYRFATTGMSDQTVLHTIAILLWIVWVIFTVSVVLEAIAAIRGVQAPRLRGLAPVQGLAALLIAGITAGVFAVASPGPLTAALTAAPAAAAPAATAEIPPAQRTAHTNTSTAGGETIAMTRTAGTITLVVDDCGYTYQVVKGDSLWRIAKECLGDPQRWPEILKLNKGKYWPHISGPTKLSDPGLIFPGWELTLPADATIPADAEPVIPPAPPAQTPAPSPSVSESPSPAPAESVGPSSAPALTPTPGAAPGGSVAPPSTAFPSASTGSGGSPPAPSAAPTTEAPATEDDSSVDDRPLSGVDLPGGWIPAALGAGLLAAVAMVWRRRRHRYRPAPITTPRLDDPDLLPPLAAMTRIRQTLRRSNPELLDHTPPPAPTVAEYASADVKPPLPPTGPTGSDIAGAAQLPMATGLGLTGDGALDAARGLLIAVLTSGSDDDPDAKGHAVVPAATLAALLGVSALDLGPIARLMVTDTTADAITVLEEEFIRRSRITAEAQLPSVKALRDNDVHAEALPQLLLICEHSEPEWDTRLAAIIRLGHSADIGAVIIGRWPAGTTLDVAADGTTGNDQTPRLAVLDPATTTEMLHLLREAHGDTDTTPAGRHTPSPTPAAASTNGQPDGERSSAAPEEDTGTPESSPAPGPPVTVRILGRPVILGADGQPGPTRPRARGMEMLVYLALNRKGVTKSALLEVLYPHAPLSRAKDSLSTDLGSLRNALKHAAEATGAGNGEPPSEWVINTGTYYHLNPKLVTVDWWTVTDLYTKIAQATDDISRLAHLTAAIAANSGPLAEDLDYEWLHTDREVVRRTQIKLHTHAAALHAHDNPHQAWLLLDQACDLDPLSEDLACQAMRAAADTGDADAIRHRLKVLRDALDDAGIDLDQATETLAKDLLRNLQHPRRSE